MRGALEDLRYALRRLRNRPGFTSIAGLTLPLGIGSTTAVFSLVAGALFCSLRCPHAEELVSVGVADPIFDGEFLFAGRYLSSQRQQTQFSRITSWGLP